MESTKIGRLAIIFYFSFMITRLVWEGLHELLKAKVYWGRSPAGLPLGSLVFFPLQHNVLGCGIAAIVSYKNNKPTKARKSVGLLDELVKPIEGQGCQACHKK